MKAVINLSKVFNEDFFKYSLRKGDTPFTYEIDILTDLKENFSSLISNTSNLKEEINYAIKDETTSLEDKKFLLKSLGKESFLLSSAEYISFIDFTYPEIKEYLKQNPDIQKKKILFRNINLDSSLLKDLQKTFGSDLLNYYFLLPENNEIISFKDYIETYEKISFMADKIKSYNFSPMEEVMLAYDLVRNKVYQEEDKNDKKSTSRDLTSVLKQDKIVCLGYANIFKALLDKLKIKNDIAYLHLERGKLSHARNEVYIKDDKYNINGVYFFDPTWDSKKKENDNSYLLSYKYFGKTKEEMNKLDQGKLVDYNFPFESLDNYFIFGEFLEGHDLKDLKSLDIDIINHMSLFMNNKHLVLLSPGMYEHLSKETLRKAKYAPSKEELLSELNDLIDLYTNPIKGEILMEVLFNVQSKLYYNNENKYDFNIESFKKIALNSNWKFKGTSEEELNKLISLINQKKLNYNLINRYLEKEELLKKLERIKLAKVIKEDYQRKRG